MDRNLLMAERIEAAQVRYPFPFVVAGDSGAWPDPKADAIFAQLLRQTAELRPAFFANLGDFAGPGTRERHARYLELVSGLEIPNVCLIGNHDLEDPRAAEAWAAVHGPRNFQFACAGTRFVAIDGASGQAGPLGDTRPSDTAGPGPAALRFLDSALFHAVQITLHEDGGVSGRVLQAFAPPGGAAPFAFGARNP